MTCQLLEILAQSDAACILAACEQLLSAQATGHRGVTHGLGLGQSHPPPPGSRPCPRGLCMLWGTQGAGPGHSPAIRSQGWALWLLASCLNLPPKQLCGPHKAQPRASGQCHAEGAEGREIFLVPEGIGGKDREGASRTEEGAVEVEVGTVVRREGQVSQQGMMVQVHECQEAIIEA